MFTHRIDTELELRLLEARDSAALFALVDANRDYLREWLPWVDAHSAEEASTRFIMWSRRQFAEGKDIVAALWYQGKLVGLAGLHNVAPGGSGVIGYWIAQEHQGRGIVTRAVRALISYGFAAGELHRVEIRCAPGNEKSLAIPLRLGFQHEGTLREAELLYGRRVDSMIFGMLRSSWPGMMGNDL